MFLLLNLPKHVVGKIVLVEPREFLDLAVIPYCVQFYEEVGLHSLVGICIQHGVLVALVVGKQLFAANYDRFIEASQTVPAIRDGPT